jgi:hypothetical protein
MMNDDNFASIDRLVEFSLGIAVAQQMTASMNQAIQNTLPSGPKVVSTRYHAMFDGKETGPFTEDEFSRLIVEGKVNKTTYVWRPGMTNWQRAEDNPEALRLVALASPPFNPEGT